jgi:uncharacterized protein
MTALLIDGPKRAAWTVILAHGAGAPMDSPFMAAIAAGLSKRGLRVVRFEFPYMAARREGRRRPPDREPVLLDTWRDVVAGQGDPGRLVIGGKSMGGRMASLVADESGVRGLLCLGFPFHAPGKPPGARIAHLARLTTPTLIVQGTRDTMGTREDVAGYKLSRTVRIAWIEGGDHSLEPLKRSGSTTAETWAEAVEAAHRFVAGLA